MIETIKLKNGAEEAKMLVGVIMLSLQELLKEKPIIFYELVQLCRNPEHELFSDVVVAELKNTNLIEVAGTVHSSIKNIVLSAVTGEGIDLFLKSPVDQGGDNNV